MKNYPACKELKESYSNMKDCSTCIEVGLDQYMENPLSLKM